MDIYKIRRQNLQAIVDTEFDGKPAAFADKMGKTPSEITRHIPRRKGAPKNIGSSLARQFEAAANKPEGWLDRLHIEAREQSPYYNTLSQEEMQDIAEEKAFHYVDVWEEMSGQKLSAPNKRELFRLIKDYFMRKLIAGKAIPYDDEEIKQEIEAINRIVQITSKNKGAA